MTHKIFAEKKGPISMSNFMMWHRSFLREGEETLQLFGKGAQSPQAPNAEKLLMKKTSKKMFHRQAEI